MIKIGTFVCKFCLIGQYQKAVCKSFRNVELLLVLRGKNHAKPFSVGLRTGTKVYRHIKYGTAHCTHQLALRILFLVMKSAQNALDRHGLVVLYKYHVESRLMEIVLIVCLHKITALVLENSRFNYIKSLDVTWCYFNLSHFSISFLCRYFNSFSNT